MMVQLNELESGRAALAPALATLCQELVGVLSELSEAQQQVVELEAEHKDRLLLLDSKMNARDLSKIDEFEEEQVKGGKEEEEEEKEREESCSSSYIANISDSSARAVLQGINVFIQEDQEALDAARKEEATPIAAETSSIRAVSPSPSLLEHMFHDNMLGGAEQRLPEEWITVISRSQGRPYYFNKRTRQSTWTLPGSEKEFGFHSAGNSATSSPTSSPRRGSAACRLGFANGLHPPPLSQKLHSDYPTPPPPRPLLPPVGGLSTLETRLHALEESVNRVLEVPQEERSSCGLIPRDASSFETPRMVKACRVPSSRCTVGAGNKNFTMYEIIVLLSHGGTIPVNHRFSDFVQLHRRLIKLFPHVSLPKVSVELFSSQASRWFNRFDPDLIECRRVWLEQYINELIESPQLETSQPFRSFLFEPSSSASRAGEEATSIAGSQTTMLSNFTSASSRPAG
uniref:WW domain-containing protein n=1 Tax=Guillardia theta TaxID=55529 RepID=A0A7S4HA29_GUITH|mmetsp:Transcript_11837/g.40787  ORF Transcript_11837/g.40787 Transcript_11837/m.40787 type:complete len:458 (+) Transcript_11837:1-1374(+)